VADQQTLPLPARADAMREAQPTGLLGYPPGAWLIIGVEFWERFSFYGMLAILVLFLTGDPAHGGFDWPMARALSVLGAYTLAMYAFPAVGGYLADHVLGRRRAVALGASVMLIGQTLTASPAYLPALLAWWHHAPLSQALRSLGVPLGQLSPSAQVSAAIAQHGAALDPTHGVAWLSQAYAASAIGFYASLFFLILGNALMKSTLVVLCGETFRPDDPRRDGAFAYYYLGISVGAMLSGLVVGLVADAYGWPYGFAVGAVGMAVSLSLYLLYGPRWLRGIGEREAVKPSAAVQRAVTPATAPSAPQTGRHHQIGRRIALLLLLAAMMCVFSTGWNQIYGSWSLFIEHSVNRAVPVWPHVVPTPWFTSINAIVVIAVAPVIAALWVRLAARNQRVDIVQKFSFALAMCMLGNGIMYVAGLTAARAGHAPLWMPLAGVAFLGLGEIVAWTATYGFVTTAAPAGFVSVAMGAWYLLTLGLGGYLSGLTGQWVDSLGYTGTFGAIAAAMGIVAVLGLLARRALVRLATRGGVTL
jgi:proton-dependent oligopeptide transporter, POT family